MLVLKYVLFSAMLLLVSIRDIKTRIIPDYYHVAILIIGLIQFKPILSIVGILAALPFLVVAIITNSRIGGADIKFMTVVGFVLGFEATIAAAIIGLILFVIYAAIKNGFNAKDLYPLLPFLSIGIFAIVLMQC